MNFFILIISITLTSISSYANTDSLYNLDGFSEEILMDPLYNLPYMGDGRLQIVPVYYLDIPASIIRSELRSRFIDANTERFVKVEYKGQTFERLYFLKKNEVYQSILKQFPEQHNDKQYKGIKMTSHSTYFVQDIDNPSDHIYIKFKDTSGTTWNHTVQIAVGRNDYLKTIFDENPNESFVSFLQEPYAMAVSEGKYTHYFSLRSVDSDRRPIGNDGDLKLFPLHGYLGSPNLKKLLKQNNRTMESWLLEEYIPKLAKFIALTNFEYGIYTEAHTQNLLAYINESSGKIKSFVFRDLGDTSIDPFVRMAKGQNPIRDLFYIEDHASRIGVRHVGATVANDDIGYDAGWVNSAYIGYWNLTKVSNSNTEFFNKLLETFFSSFIPEVEKVTGVTLDREKLPSYSKSSIGPSQPGYDLFQAIYEQVIDEKLENLAPEKTAKLDQLEFRINEVKFELEQEELVKEFKNTPVSSIAFLRSNSFKLLKKNRTWASKKPIIYLYDGKHIALYDKSSKKIIAITNALSDSFKEYTSRDFKKTPIFKDPSPKFYRCKFIL